MRLPKSLIIATGLLLAVAGWTAAGRAASSLHLACNDFPPHKNERPAEDGRLGFDVDIVAEALKRVGRSADISFLPWKRALELAGRGEYDGLCSCSYAKGREAKLLFSD